MRRTCLRTMSVTTFGLLAVVACRYPTAPERSLPYRPPTTIISTTTVASEEEPPRLQPPPGSGETLNCAAFAGRTAASISRVEYDLVWLRARYEGVPVTARYRLRFWPHGRHIPPVFDWDVGPLARGDDYVEELGPFRVPGINEPTWLDYNIDFEAVGTDERGPLLVQCDRGAAGHPVEVRPPPQGPPTTTAPPVVPPPVPSCEQLHPMPTVIGDGSWHAERAENSAGALYLARVSAAYEISDGALAGEARIVWTNGSSRRVKAAVPIARACGAPKTVGGLSWTSEPVPANHGHVNCGARYDLVIVDATGTTVFSVTLPRLGTCP